MSDWSEYRFEPNRVLSHPHPHPMQVATQPCPIEFTPTLTTTHPSTTTILSLPSTIIYQLSEYYLYANDLCSLGHTCKLLFGDVRQSKIVHWPDRFHSTINIPFDRAVHSFTRPRSVWTIGRITSLQIESDELDQLDQLCSKLDDSPPSPPMTLVEGQSGRSTKPLVSAISSPLDHIRQLKIECNNNGLGDGPFRLPPRIISLHLSNEGDDRRPIPITKFFLPDTLTRIEWSYGEYANYGDIELRLIQKWPRDLTELIGLTDYGELDCVQFPSGLLNLTCRGYANFHLVQFPNSITNLELTLGPKVPFDHIILPISLKRLQLSFNNLGETPSLTHLPRTCENLQLHLSDRIKLSCLEIPNSIKQISLLLPSYTKPGPIPVASYFSDASSLTSLRISRLLLAQIDLTKVDMPQLIRLKIEPSVNETNQPLQSHELPINLLEIDLSGKHFWVYEEQTWIWDTPQSNHISWMDNWVCVLPQHLEILHLYTWSYDLGRSLPTSIHSISFKECFDGQKFESDMAKVQPSTILPNVKLIDLGDTDPSTLESWSRIFPEAQVTGDWTTRSKDEDGQTTKLYYRLTYFNGGRLKDRVPLSFDEKFGRQWRGPYFAPLLYDTYDTFPSATSVADTPPAARLVGIELNPGPSSTQPGPLTSSSTSTTSRSDCSTTHPTAAPNPTNLNSTSSHRLTWSERTDWILERNEWNRKDPTSVYLALLMDTAELVKDLADIVLTYLEPPHYYQPYDHGRQWEPGSYLIPLPRSARPLAVAFQLQLNNFEREFFIRPDVYIITQFHGKLIEEDQEKDHDNFDCSAHPTSLPTTTSDQSSTILQLDWSYRPTHQVGVMEVISNSSPHNQVGYGILLDHLKEKDQTIQLCHMFPSNWSHLSSFQLRRRGEWVPSTFITFTFFYINTPTKSTPIFNSLSSNTHPHLIWCIIHRDTPCLPLPCRNVSFSLCRNRGGELLLSYPFTTMAQTCQADASGVPSTIAGDRSYEELRWSYHQAARKGVEVVQQLTDELKSAGEAMLRERSKLSTNPWSSHSDLYLDDGELPSNDHPLTMDAFDPLMRDYHETWLSDPTNQSRVPFNSTDLSPSTPTELIHQPPHTRAVEPFERKLDLELETVRMELTQAHQTIEELNATINTKEKELIAMKDHYETIAIPNLVYTHQQQIKEYVAQVSELTNRLRSFEVERRRVTVDSNLGPPSQLTNSTPIIQIFPQTMFTDGLHLISTYLDERDFVASLQVCHHWTESFSSSTSRGMSYPIEMDGTFRSLPHMRLRHHFTQLRVRGILPEMTMKQLFLIGREFPFLNQFLSLRILPDQNHSTLPMVNFWPEGLKELVIDLEDFISPQLIQTISTCISLVRLSLSRVSQHEDFSLFQSYELLIYLEYFQLTGYSPRDIDLLSLIRWCSGPPNLRVLKFGSNFFSVTTFSQLREWPILEEIQLPTVLKEGELALIALSVPNLRIIQLEICPLADFVLLKQFQSLHTLRLGSSVRPDESGKIQAICDCSQLTSLQFTHDPPQLSSSWVQLSHSLLNLVELSFWASCSPNPLDVLLPFQSLTKLVFEETDSESSTYVRHYFRSPTVMPQLYHIEITGVFTDWMNWIWRKDGQNNTVLGDQFREPPHQRQLTNQPPATSTPTAAREPPLEDLTIQGIEPNQGN